MSGESGHPIGPELYRGRARRQIFYVGACLIIVTILSAIRIYVPAFADDFTLPAGIAIVVYCAFHLLGRIDELFERMVKLRESSPEPPD